MTQLRTPSAPPALPIPTAPPAPCLHPPLAGAPEAPPGPLGAFAPVPCPLETIDQAARVFEALGYHAWVEPCESDAGHWRVFLHGTFASAETVEAALATAWRYLGYGQKALQARVLAMAATEAMAGRLQAALHLATVGRRRL